MCLSPGTLDMNDCLDILVNQATETTRASRELLVCRNLELEYTCSKLYQSLRLFLWWPCQAHFARHPECQAVAGLATSLSLASIDPNQGW